MANTIKQKRGTSDPGASDLVVGELAINTTDGGVFTKTDGGTVVEVGGSGGASAINDLSDAVTYSSGSSIGLGTNALANDDGTDNKNVALGLNASTALTSGSNNTAIGWEAGKAQTTAVQNTLIGARAGAKVTTAPNNTFVGYESGFECTTGDRNVGVGRQALDAITTGEYNTVMGYQAMGSSGTGVSNTTALGYQALKAVTADDNTAVGYQALESNTTGTNNIAVGYQTLNASTTATQNTAVGYQALNSNTTGGALTAIGYRAAASTTTPNQIVAIGAQALEDFTGNSTLGFNVAIGQRCAMNVTTPYHLVAVGNAAFVSATTGGTFCVIVGSAAAEAVTTATEVTAVGYKALSSVTTGGFNTALGKQAGDNITTGSNCTVIGAGADASSATATNEVTLGNSQVTSLRIPGLQSGASDGQVLTYNSTNGNITLADAGGASAINDLSDAVTYDSGEGIGLGTGALANDDGSDNYNTALGYNAGNATTSGEANVFVGYEAGSSRTTVGKSVCVGYEAGRYPNTYHTTAIGYQALKGSSSAQVALNNTAVGTYAGLNTQSTYIGPGGRNVFMGYAAAKDHTTGEKNVVIGATAGEHMTTGQKNVVIGRGAAAGETEYARRLTTGDNNIIIGNNAEASSSTVDNEITLGDPNITSLRIPGLQSGASDEDVLTYDSTNGNITLKPKSVSSSSTFSSGTHNVDFTSIATNWTKIEVLFDNISTSNVNNILLQVGTSSGFIESGYDSHSAGIGSTAINGTTNGAGFGCRINGDNHTVTGAYTLTKFSTGGTNVMVLSNLSANRVDNDSSMYGRGHIEIDTSTGIDRVRLTTSGSDNFDKDGVVFVRAFY